MIVVFELVLCRSHQVLVYMKEKDSEAERRRQKKVAEQRGRSMLARPGSIKVIVCMKKSRPKCLVLTKRCGPTAGKTAVTRMNILLCDYLV